MSCIDGQNRDSISPEVSELELLTSNKEGQVSSTPESLGDSLSPWWKCLWLTRARVWRRAFWRAHWWRVLLFALGALVLSILGVVLTIALVFSSTSVLVTRWGVLLFILVAFVCVQCIASALFFAFPSHRSCRYVKLRARCILPELMCFFLLAEIAVLLLLPSAFLFASAPFNELPSINVNLRSSLGRAELRRLGCDWDARLVSAQRFFNCSLRVESVSFFWGGAPRLFPNSAAGMAIFRNVFFKAPHFCPSEGLLIHELFHVYQYERGWWSATVLADELLLQATQRSVMYDYGGAAALAAAAAQQRAFSSYNMEQQASIVEHYYAFWRLNLTSAPHAHFVEPLLKDCLS